MPGCRCQEDGEEPTEAAGAGASRDSRLGRKMAHLNLCFFSGLVLPVMHGSASQLLVASGPFIVDFPMKNLVIFHSYVKLPEGNLCQSGWWFGTFCFFS